MFNFLKNKNFAKLCILFGISLVFAICFLLNKNLSTSNLKGVFYKEAFNKLNKDFEDFFEIKKVVLNGRKKTNLDSIKNIVHSDLEINKNIIKFDILKLKKSLEKINWINKVSIRKNFPGKIIINITEHKEFAILNKNKRNFLVSNEGKIIYEISDPNAYKQIHLEGSLVLENIEQIEKFLINNRKLKKQISKIIVISDNRWDLIINNVLFKLPRKNKEEAINQINKFYKVENLEIVDLRFFEKKIYMKIDSKKIAMKNKK